MKLGVFTPLLSQLPLDAVLAKLKAMQIDTVELATGNYPGNAHCKLSMLDNAAELKEFKLPWQSTAPKSCDCEGESGDQSKDDPAGREIRSFDCGRLFGMPG